MNGEVFEGKLSFREVINAIPEIDYICVDVANGYSEHFVEFVRLVRKEFPDKTIFVAFRYFQWLIFFFLLLQAGNVVTCEMVEELILSGADIVKCGIGPGLID
jgi:GMP reductase